MKRLGLTLGLNASGGSISSDPLTDFRILVKTDNAGVSNDDQFQFTGAVGNYDVEVWNEAGTALQETFTGLSGAATITIAAGAGTYELRVFAAETGGFNRIRFNNSGDKDKLLKVRNWGDINWAVLSFSFRGCSNLGESGSITAINLSLITSLQGMFAGCSNFNMDLSTWDVSGVSIFSDMFFSCAAFSSDLSNWDVSSATTMPGMFNGCTNIDFNLGGWDVSNVTIMDNMFLNTSLSTANYDALLIAWASLPSLQNNVSFHGGNSTYTAGGAAEAARTSLATTYLWIIADGGPV